MRNKTIKLFKNVIPKLNLPTPSSFIKIEPMDVEEELANSQADDPLIDPSEDPSDTNFIDYITADMMMKSRISIATQVNWPGDKEFRFNFLDLLTTDRDLNGWTGLTSFDCLQSLVKRIPTSGANIASTYGLSLPNLIVMVLVRTKMNIPFDLMSVLFPMKAALLSKCFSEFLPILEVATRKSIPPPEKIKNIVKDTEFIIERPTISNVGSKGIIRKITTSKTSIRINPIGTITAVVPIGTCKQNRNPEQTSSAAKFDLILDENTGILKPASISRLLTAFIFNHFLRCSIYFADVQSKPPIRADFVSSSNIPPNTEQCKETIQRLKSFRILNDKVAPSMALYMDTIVRLVCGVLNYSKVSIKCNDITTSEVGRFK